MLSEGSNLRRLRLRGDDVVFYILRIFDFQFSISLKLRAFTLIELMLVLAIMAVLAGLAVPILSGTLELQRLKSAGNTIRAEWMEARVRAMDEGQIFCFRCQLGGNQMIVDRVLDAHFTASLSSRETTNRFDTYNELDPFEKGAFSGDSEDFILRDPAQASEETGTRFIELPKSTFAADLIAMPDERAAFYLGLTSAGESDIEDNVSESDEVTQQEIRLGQTSGSDGSTWSTPIFFYPDGTTSTAALLLKSDSGRCIEVRLRSITGLATMGDIFSVESYSGELDPSRERSELESSF